MYLKRLQLVGFKTFAEKTLIEFSEGVTAIVGPNGSGKSNIADAILWALGEQRPSAIRGAKLQDVIFSGSALRKPTGLAEVSLTVDNSDGSLPLSYDEITITRRAYRNGESEFSINKTPCRLKDIQELFLDTGVGRESYALVNQSEVDAVLSADPQARRPLFEEAAGIHKFRVRKREALRKLEATESNLVRIRDIVREIDRQLGPLQAQAEVALRYNAAKERLESLEKNFLINEVRQIDGELTAVRSEREAASKATEEKTILLRHAEDRANGLAQMLAQLDTALDGVRARHQAALSHFERVRSDRELAEQRGQGIKAQIDLVKAEIDDIVGRLEASRDNVAGVKARLRDVHEQTVGVRTQIGTLDGQRHELLPKISELRKSEETRFLRAAERERARASREAEMLTLQSHVAQTAAQERDLETRLEELDQRLKAGGTEQKARMAEHQEAIGLLKSAETEMADVEKEVQSRRDALHSSQSAVSKLQAEIASLRSRLQTLQELEAAQEGYYSGVRAVLQAVKRGKLSGEFTVVADAFRAPEGYDVAFEVALGGSVQDIIVETESDAKAGIELLKRDRAGRATFLPLNRVRVPGPRPNIPSGLPGFLGCGADLATYDGRYTNVIEMLLGRTLFCTGIDEALPISERARGWSKIVTLSGEVLLPSGAISGGSAAKSTGSLLHRKTEIGTLTERARTGKEQLQAAERLVVESQEGLRAALSAQSQASAKLQICRQSVNQSERVLDQASREVERHERDGSEAQARLVLIRAEHRRAVQMLDTQRLENHEVERLQAASDRGPGASETVSTSLLPMLLESDQRLQEELMQLRIVQASAQERAHSDEQAIRQAETEMERLEMQRVKREERLEALLADTSTLEERADVLTRSVEEASARFDTLHADMESRQAERLNVAADAREAQMLARRLAEERSQVQALAQSAELREAKLQMQQTQSATRLLEEYDVTVQDALSIEGSSDVADDTPREVARLRRELRGLGDVNPHAAAEYTELRDRFDNLTTQQQDAELAKAKVMEAIREIDDSTRDLFMTSFHKVAEAFESIFQRLFGGGKTELSLTDPNNLLETGVEIAIQAPGKKKQNLMLLSGGERALTAVALLFAFLEVRPAPFCVMDEVDAPLDGVNVERFANLLRDFGKTGQFLVITHNPSTMEAARTWYGVTMQEPGVSRVLSMTAPSDANPSAATTEEMTVAGAAA